MQINDDTLPDSPTMVHSPAPASRVAGLTVKAWGASSSVGLRREVNEDRFGRQGDVFAVADGMGGHSGGVEASERAIETALSHAANLGTGAPLDDWRALVQVVNAKVRTEMQRRGHEKAGCTLTLAAVEADRIVAAHVGDSRLYELQAGVLAQCTDDHNLLGELTDLGSDVEEAVARGLPLAGLTSYIGQSDASLRVDVFETRPESGTRLLLSTDGVHRYLQQHAIADVLAGFPPVEAAEELVRRADGAGGARQCDRDSGASMSVRRAEYREGPGLLAAGGGRLLYVDAVDHPAVSRLREAVCDTRALRSLAAVVASAGFDMPSFIYVEAGDRLQSIVCGQVRLTIHDTKESLVDGTAADPWAHSYSSADATVAYGCDSGDFDGLWIESGVVRASAFRWSCHDETLDPLAATPAIARPSSHEAKPEKAPTGQETVTGEPTLSTLDDADLVEAARERTVEALVCLECEGLNPPMTARCRSCNALLSGINSEVRTVAQPTLGVLHLSGDLVERVDADLLIGRNPARFGLKHHQRAVVHGIGDQSVSRLHLELTLDGWAVMATNLKRGRGTTIETRLGGRANLAYGVPHQLNDGDTIHFGGAWLRYEEGVQSLEPSA